MLVNSYTMNVIEGNLVALSAVTPYPKQAKWFTTINL